MAIMGLISRGHGIHDGEYLLVHLCGEEITSLSCFAPEITVEPPKRGHFGNGTFVLSSEVVLFSEVV